MQLKIINIVTLLLLISLLPLHANENNIYSPLGINTNEVLDDDASAPFVDLFRGSTPFEEARPWLTKGKIIYDKDGWPTNLNGGQVGTRFINKLPAGTIPDGNYVVLYDGVGTLQYGNDVKLISKIPGREVISIKAGPDKELRASLIIIKSDISNPLKNIRVLMPGGICSNNPYKRVHSEKNCKHSQFLSFEKHSTQIIFNPDYLNYMKSFKVIRFMNMAGITRNPIKEWARRPKMSKSTWGGKPTVRGAPLEIMVALANKNNSDAWFSLPHAANDDYIRKFAQYVRDNLKPDLKAYIEYTNEAWNTIFSQAHYMKDMGLKLGLDQDRDKAGYKYYSFRSVQLFNIFEEEFQGTDRIIRVLGSWTGYTQLTEMILSYRDAYLKTDSVAIGPYFYGSTSALKKVKSVDEVFTILYDQKLPFSIPGVKKLIAKHFSISKSFGVDLIAYEGGQHLVDWKNRDITEAPTKYYIEANRDPRMATAYTDLLNSWKESGGSIFILFSAPRTYQWFGSWGTKEYLNQPLTETPKHRGILNFITNNQCWWAECETSNIVRLEKPEINPSRNIFSRVPNKPSSPSTSSWILYLSSLFLFLCALLGITYIRRYRHPLLLQLTEKPDSLLNLPIEQLEEAIHRLKQTNRLKNSLNNNQLSLKRIQSVIGFYSFPKSMKINTLLMRFETSAVSTDFLDPKKLLFKLSLSSSFPLNINSLLVCFPKDIEPEDLLNYLKYLPDTQSKIILIIGCTSSYQRQLYNTTHDLSNKWVAPQSSEITNFLLAPDTEKALAKILSEQLSLQQISPYRIGGGVNNESVFFGRRELISQIINRDPANYLLVGGRQVGKSSLLKAIERRYSNNPQVECVYLTLSSEVLVPRLASLLKLKRTDNPEELAAQLDDRVYKSGQRFVFLIDEADRFIAQEKDRDYSILNVFRRLSEEGNCTFVLAGFWQLYQHAVLDYQSPIRNFGELLSVGKLEKAACLELVGQPMKTMNLFYANEFLIEHIVDSCGQRANLIAIVCQHLVRNLPPKQRVIETGDIDKALKSDELRRALSGWVVGETEHEQAYERMVVYATIKMQSFTTGELLELAKQHGLAIDTLALDCTLSRLELAFVLGRNNGHWFYRIPLFVDYITEDSPELKLQAELSRLSQYS